MSNDVKEQSFEERHFAEQKTKSVIVETVYFINQEDGETDATDSRHEVACNNGNEQLYVRRLKATADYADLDCGWITSPSLATIKNLSQTTLLVTYTNDDCAFKIPPNHCLRFVPYARLPMIRSLNGDGRFQLKIHP